MALQSRTIYMGLNEYLKYNTNTPDANRRLVDEIKSLFPLHQYERLTPITTELRLCKKPEEIETISKAIDITKHAFRQKLLMNLSEEVHPDTHTVLLLQEEKMHVFYII